MAPGGASVMTQSPAPFDPCPFLTPVVADWLWVYPVGAYCRRSPGRVRVRATSTLQNVCSTSAHAECPGYRASVAGTQSATV